MFLNSSSGFRCFTVEKMGPWAFIPRNVFKCLKKPPKAAVLGIRQIVEARIVGCTDLVQFISWECLHISNIVCFVIAVIKTKSLF